LKIAVLSNIVLPGVDEESGADDRQRPDSITFSAQRSNPVDHILDASDVNRTKRQRLADKQRYVEVVIADDRDVDLSH
jgi:hypothetical protein